MEFSTVWQSFVQYLKDIFNIYHDTDWKGAIDDIKAGIHYRGANLWTLIFAILIASVGLNVNSTAVVIGAMLISPLMGPILGAGLALGTNDIGLFKDSARNMLVAVVISVLASALYFSLTPLHEAQSELLARTRPTIFDVLIALFGGIIGIVVSTREGYSNAIPGVAIATALMPPLCTAGYGLATGQWPFFFGALYLFFINGIFIALATMVVVRYLKFPKRQYLDEKTERRARLAIVLVALITILPSVFVAISVVREAVFKQRVDAFLRTAFRDQSHAVIKYEASFGNDSSKLVLNVLGPPVTNAQRTGWRRRLDSLGLARTHLVVHELNQGLSEKLSKRDKDLRSQIIRDLYLRQDSVIHDKDRRIKILEERLVRLEKSRYKPVRQIFDELKINYPEVRRFAFDEVVQTDGGRADTVPVALIDLKGRLSPARRKKLARWLQVRLRTDTLQLVTY